MPTCCPFGAERAPNRAAAVLGGHLDLRGLAAMDRGEALVVGDAYPARVFHGAIRQVRSSPQIVQNVVTYNAVIDVANPDLALKPGMTANLEVVYADRADVLRVANAALRFRASPDLAGKVAIPPSPGKKLVWVMRAGAPQRVEITTRVSDSTNTEVVDGALHPGDQVVTEANPTHPASGAGRML